MRQLGGVKDVFDVLAEADLRAMSDEERRKIRDLLRRRGELAGDARPPVPWPTSDPWHLIRQVFPNYATAPLAPHHQEWWRWVWALWPGRRPRPFVGIWNRAGAKTSSVQMGLALAGAHRRRHYVLYVARTQKQADDKVADFSAMFTQPHFAARWPEMAQRKQLMVSTAGGSRRTAEWNRVRIRTAAGFTVEGVGLDVAARGIKMEDQRPDVIVFDDVDDQEDNPGKILKVLAAIRRALIPAGSADVAIVHINNLVHDNSVSSHITYPDRFPEKEQLLLDRYLSGPVPAVWDLEVERSDCAYVDDSGLPVPGYVIVGGRPSWEGFPIEAAQSALNASNLTDFLGEYQHDVEEDGEFFSHIDWKLADLADVPWGRMIQVQCWVDPATSDTDRSDSMGLSVAGVDTYGVVWVLYSWEQITSPTEALKQAYRKAREYGASVLGIETDNGGDAWFPVAREALRELREDGETVQAAASNDRLGFADDWRRIKLVGERAGQTGKSKVERIKQLITPFERQRIVLVRGTHNTLIKGLRRFPKKPLDGVDAFWWAWHSLVESGDRRPTTARTAARRTVARPSPQHRR